VGAVSANYITNGKYQGFYATYTISGTIGSENGIGVSAFVGYYNRQGDPDPQALLGTSFTITPGGAPGYFQWASTSLQNAPWEGSGYSEGVFGIGFQVGYSFGIYGFSK
jgi:hypothetical protein